MHKVDSVFCLAVRWFPHWAIFIQFMTYSSIVHSNEIRVHHHHLNIYAGCILGFLLWSPVSAISITGILKCVYIPRSDYHLTFGAQSDKPHSKISPVISVGTVIPNNYCHRCS